MKSSKTFYLSSQDSSLAINFTSKVELKDSMHKREEKRSSSIHCAIFEIKAEGRKKAEHKVASAAQSDLAFHMQNT
jgi:hypothetical protein